MFEGVLFVLGISGLLGKFTACVLVDHIHDGLMDRVVCLIVSWISKCLMLCSFVVWFVLV